MSHSKEDYNMYEFHYRSLAENSSDFIIRFAPDLTHIYVNKATELFTGISREEFLGKSHRDLGFPEELADYWEEQIGQVFQTGVNYRAQFTMHVGEQPVTLDWHLIPEFDSAGKVCSVLSTSRDITELERAKQLLKEQAAFFSRTKKIAKVGSWQLNLITNELTWSPHAYHIFQVPEGTPLTYEKFLTYVHPDDVEYLDQQWQLAINNQNEYDVEHRIIVAGEVKWVRELVEFEFDETGAIPIYAYGAVQDITDFKITQLALHMSEERFRSYIEKASDLIFTVVCDGTISYVSPNIMEMLGYQQREIVGENLANLIHWQDVHILNHSILKRVKNSKERDKCYINSDILEFRARHKKGQWRWFSAKESVLHTSEELLEVIVTARDVTEQKQLEEELDKYYTDIENLYQHLEREINRAKEVHEKSFPEKLPEVAGVSFAAVYNPAEKIGGDLYDVIQKDDQLIMYISDVTGHGLDSAILSSFIKNTINAYVALNPGNVEPKELISFLNKQLQSLKYPEDYFICIFILIYEIASKELTYMGVGFHDLPLVVTADGEISFLDNSGLPISTALDIDKFELRDKKISLTDGSSILLYTDGLSEQRVGDQHFKEKLIGLMANKNYLPPDALSHYIMNEFASCNNGVIQGEDDITFLIMKIDSSPKETYHWEINKLSQLQEAIEDIAQILPESNEALDIILVIHELSINGLEHGNLFDEGKKISIDLVILTGEYITATIHDQGNGFDWKSKLGAPLELEGVSERGRGLALSAVFSKEIYYNHSGNKVVVVFDFFET